MHSLIFLTKRYILLHLLLSVSQDINLMNIAKLYPFHNIIGVIEERKSKLRFYKDTLQWAKFVLPTNTDNLQ